MYINTHLCIYTYIYIFKKQFPEKHVRVEDLPSARPPYIEAHAHKLDSVSIYKFRKRP